MADDVDQQKVIDLAEPEALVLAGPGCGKTHTLAQRIYHAALYRGIPATSMLCLTFTNRAAREMAQRVESYFGHRPHGLFIGTLHRLCLRLLFANDLLQPDTSVLDDDDMVIFVNENIHSYCCNHNDIQRTATIMYMREHSFSRTLFPNEKEKSTAVNIDNVIAYRRFKEENHLIDYDDILILAYSALRDKKAELTVMTNYRWIQIDEVQDLSPLQLAIIDLLKGSMCETLYLGDEQQSIYGFAGAGKQVLDTIKGRCRNSIYRLYHNYRSPKQLVDFCNAYARQYLDIAPEFLPTSVNSNKNGHCLMLMRSPSYCMTDDAAAMARQFLKNAQESTAILTRTNNDAIYVSKTLSSYGIEHILVSQHDLFKGASFKTLWSHLSAISRPDYGGHWARLLYQTHSTYTLTEARILVSRMIETGISPRQLLELDAKSDIERMVEISEKKDEVIAVFDTETTGLDPLNDDIIQISAVKMCGGRIIDGNRFSIFIQSDKKPPKFIGSHANPLYNIYTGADKLPTTVALRQFAEYLDGCTAAGHNIGFDIAILRNNYRRAGLDIPVALRQGSYAIDTLLLSRLLYPRLRSHQLEFMLGYLGIAGINSHNADDDCDATAKLLQTLHRTAKARIPKIQAMMSKRHYRHAAHRLTETYGELYATGRSMLEDTTTGNGNSLAGAFSYAYNYLRTRDFIKPLHHLTYLLELIDKHIVDSRTEPRLFDQLGAHLHDLLSFNEGDLYSLGIIKERLVVMTIHKAKGMEMDNVIVYKAGKRLHNESLEESMRVFYVAVSRARKRLLLLFNNDPKEAIGLLSRHFEELSLPGARPANDEMFE